MTKRLSFQLLSPNNYHRMKNFVFCSTTPSPLFIPRINTIRRVEFGFWLSNMLYGSNPNWGLDSKAYFYLAELKSWSPLSSDLLLILLGLSPLSGLRASSYKSITPTGKGPYPGSEPKSDPNSPSSIYLTALQQALLRDNLRYILDGICWE